MTFGIPKILCATGFPRRSFELSSISSIKRDALCRSPIISLMSSSFSSSVTFSQIWKQSTRIPRTSLPGTELIYRNASSNDSSSVCRSDVFDMSVSDAVGDGFRLDDVVERIK